MKVALLGPVAWRTPPRHYGPWELITSLLTEGLVARGVEVTLFATADSVTAATLDGPCPHGYAEDETLDGRVYEALHISHAFGRSAEFDLVHNHLDWLPLAFSRHCRAPLLTTIHGFSDRRILPAYQAANSAYVSISDADRVPELDYAATIHHGIDLGTVAFSPSGGEDLLILGRIHPDKGTADAIEIARRAGRRLTIAGPVQDQCYFSEQCPAARRRRPGPLPGLGRSRTAVGDPRLGRGPAAPHRVRGTVRAVGRRGDGCRHPGHRVSEGLHA